MHWLINKTITNIVYVCVGGCADWGVTNSIQYRITKQSHVLHPDEVLLYPLKRDKSLAMPLCVPCGHLLGKSWPLGSRLWCPTVSCHFSSGILGQVGYLIVSIPDLFTPTYINTNIWASTWDFQQCGMCNQQSLRSDCAYTQSDQSLC